MLVLSESNARDTLAARPQLNREATQKLANTLFPGDKLELIGDGDLSHVCPPDHEIHIGCFVGLSIIAAKEFGIDCPSKLPQRFIAAGGEGTVIVHAMHNAVDWFAYAVWKNGKLVRSLSLSPDSGVIEDIGQQLSFEKPYWAGKYSVVNGEEENQSYPFPFHPLELGEAALKELFGFQLEGDAD